MTGEKGMSVHLQRSNMLCNCFETYESCCCLPCQLCLAGGDLAFPSSFINLVMQYLLFVVKLCDAADSCAEMAGASGLQAGMHRPHAEACVVRQTPLLSRRTRRSQPRSYAPRLSGNASEHRGWLHIGPSCAALMGACSASSVRCCLQARMARLACVSVGASAYPCMP